jgi:hypothetical protein
MKLFDSVFAAGLLAAATVFAAVLFAPVGTAEAGNSNASSSPQFSQPTMVLAQKKSAGQCKSECAREYNSCVAGGCVDGSGPGGKCTSAEAVAGCNDKHGKRKASCEARC